jgi:hypothetical protein
MMSFNQGFSEARKTGCMECGIVSCHPDKSWCYSHEMYLAATIVIRGAVLTNIDLIVNMINSAAILMKDKSINDQNRWWFFHS